MDIRRIVGRPLASAISRSRTYRFLTLTIRDSWRYVAVRDYLDFRKLALFWRVCGHAQQNYASLSMAYDLATLAEKRAVSGAFVECGVWRGGCAAVMATVADKGASNRKIWLFDSFEGMPAATEEDLGDYAKELSAGVSSGQLTSVGTNVALVDEVAALLFDTLHLKKENIHIVKGWFQHTLQRYRDEIGAIAILRIDADWYESTRVCLESLFDNVVDDGYIIVDDYGFFPGCKKAVDEFIARRGAEITPVFVDYSRVYFKKPVCPPAPAPERVPPVS